MSNQKYKSYQKFVATAATATLVATALVPAASAASSTFTDVGDRYKEAVSYLVDNNITNGVSSTKFGTELVIKRVDVAVLIAKAVLTEQEIASAPDAGFKDVPARAKAYVNALKAKAIINGKTETSFGSEASITRGEAALMLAKAYEIKGNTDNVKFSDVAPRYKEAVAALVDNGITSGKSATKFGTDDSITRGELAIFLHKLEKLDNVESAVATVTSVSAANGKEFVVEFSSAVDKASAEKAANYKFNGKAIGTPVLSEDGKTVTITTASVINVENATLEIAPIQVKGNTAKFTTKYVTLFTYADTVAPVVSNVEAKDQKAVITFDEALNGTPGVTVDGVTYTNLTVAGKTLTINGLTNEKTYSVELVGAKDAAGNISHPIALGFTVGKPDAVQPQAVATSVKENKVTLSFVNALSATSAATVAFNNTAATTLTLNGTDAAGVTYSADKKTVVIDAQANGVLDGVNFLTTDITVSGAGLVTAEKTTAKLTSDKTAAILVSSQTTAAGKLVLEFNEDVKNPATLDLKVTSVDGIYQSTPIAWDKLVVAYAKDANGKDVKTTLEVTLPASVKVGTNYAVEVPATIEDTYANATAKFSVSVVKPTTENTYKPGAVITVTPAVAKNVITLTFGSTKDKLGVTSAALSASNYTLGGKALPEGTVIRNVDNKNKVEIVLPEGAIKTSGDYILTISNIADEAGNTLVAKAEKQTLTLVENVAPVATGLTLKSSNEATVTFSEAVAFKDFNSNVGTVATIEGVSVKVNDVLVTVAIAPADLTSATTLTIKGLDLKTTDVVTVEFKSAELVDASSNENQVKDVVVSK